MSLSEICHVACRLGEVLDKYRKGTGLIAIKKYFIISAYGKIYVFFHDRID